MISAIAVGLSGCAGNGEGLDQNGRPDEGGAAPLTATFASIQQNVFTPICTQCHVGAQAPVGLRLDADSSYAMLVNTPSGEVPALRRVQPGNPEASYLVQKIEGTAAVGSRMPLNNPALPQSTIDVIKQWIANGAPRDSQTGVAPKLTIQGISPLADEVLAATPGEILLQASSELDTTRLTTQNITLVRSGGDGMFDDGNESVVPVLGIDVRSTQPTVFALSLASDQTVADDYRLTISGTSAAPVMDLSGRMLNADVTEPFGQDFVMQFKVEGAR
ncbi:MAG: hypothetical protein ACJ8MR_19400 [Povalibacter sp.]